MKIHFTDKNLLEVQNASIQSVSQNASSKNKESPKEPSIPDSLTKKMNRIQEQLRSLQMSISEKQQDLTQLGTIQSQFEKLKSNLNTVDDRQIEAFMKLLKKETQALKKEKTQDSRQIPKILERMHARQLQLEREIQEEKKQLFKLKISSENLVAHLNLRKTEINETFLTELQEKIEQSSPETLNQLHQGVQSFDRIKNLLV